MSKGGGGQGVSPTPTKSTVTQTSLPEYAKEPYLNLIGRGEELTQDEYQPYGGPRIAPFKAEQELGFVEATAAGLAPPTGMLQAQDYYRGVLAGGEGGSPRGFAAQDYAPLIGEYDPGTAYKQFMDPYLDEVLGSQRRQLEQEFTTQQQGREAQRVGRGTRTGSRAAVQKAMDRDRFERRLTDAELGQRSQAFRMAQQQAQQQFLRDRAARMQAQQIGGAERMQEAQYGLQAAGAAAGADPALLQQRLAQAGALQGVGTARQKMDQANLDLAMQDFLNQRDYERRQLQFMAGLLQGVPVTPQSEVYQYQAPGSFTGQLAGAGMGGLGLYKMMTG